MTKLLAQKKNKQNYNELKIKHDLEHIYFKREELLETVKKGS